MSNPFALQVTPELMQRLVDQGDKKPQRRRQAKQKLTPPSSAGPLPTHEEHEQEVEHAPLGGGWPSRDPYFPPFGGPQAPFAGLFGGPPIVEAPVQPVSPLAPDLSKELAPVYQAIEESEQVAQRLQNQGDHELEKVQEMARDLQAKQYRAPSHAPPCTNERGSCIECYKENHKNPLLCSKLVQTFVACSRQAQEEFAASVSS